MMFMDVWDHRFCTNAKFFKKLKFLSPDTHTNECVSEDKKCNILENVAFKTNE